MSRSRAAFPFDVPGSNLPLVVRERQIGGTRVATLASPARRQALQPPQYESRTPFRIVWVVEPQAGQAPQEGCNRDLGLDPRQLRAEAKMNAAAERQRAHIRPCDVEPVGRIRIGGRIAVGRTEQANHRLTPRNLLVPDIVDVFERDSPGRLYGGVVTQKLLDRARDQLGPRFEKGELVRMAVQR